MLEPRLAVVAPDLVRGVRAAIATVVPFYLAVALDIPELGWVALGGWLGSLADPGGTRRARATGMAVFVVTAGAVIAIGGALASMPVVAAIVVAATAFGASLARVFGSAATTIGSVLAVTGAIAASTVAANPITNALAFSGGALWAVGLSSIVWRGWPHLPLRVSIAAVFETLAGYADATAAAARDREPGDPAWGELAREHQRPVRAAIESARATMVALRARHAGESPVGANLRTILGDAESLLFGMIAYSEEVETTRDGATETLVELAATFRGIRERLLTRRPGEPTPVTAIASNSAVALRLMTRARTVLDLSRDLDVDIAPAERAVSGPIPVMTAEPPAVVAPSVWAVVRDGLSWRSPILHHAIRSAVTAAVGVVVGRLVSPSHATWVTITAIAVQQPYLGATLVRVVERVVGTVIGGAIAAVVMMTIRDPLLLALAMFPLAVAAVVTRPRSYRLFVLFLTPVFVLVADRWHPELHTALVRVGDVALGGVIAAVIALIAPSWERRRLPEALVACLDAVAAYAQLVFDGGERSSLVDARRSVGAALEAAEASLERMLAEPKPLQRGTADAISLLTFTRRLSASFTTLDESGTSVRIPPPVQSYILGAVTAAKRFIVDGATTPFVDPPAVEPALARIVHHATLIARLAA